MTHDSLIGEVPENWELSTLGEACRRNGGDIQTGPFGSQLHASDYVPVGIPSIMPQNIGDNRIATDGIARIKEKDAERLNRYRVRKGDIIYSRRGDVERRAFIRGEEDGWLCGTGCLRVRFGEGNVDPLFASYYLGHPNVRDWIVGHAVGTTMPNLNTSILSALPFVSPPIDEQRAIARVLGALEDKIELNGKMNRTLEAMAKALFKSWFVDFNPVTAKVAGCKPYEMSESTAALFPSSFVESELGLIPEGWGVSKFGDEIDFLEGPGLRNWQYRDEGIKFLNIRCIDDGDLNIKAANCVSLEEFQRRYSHFALSKDDIVISTSGTLGRLAIVREDHLPLMLNTSIIRMRSNGVTGLSFIWCYLQSDPFVEEMFAAATGSVQLNFGPVHLRRISLVRPKDEVLELFERQAGTWLRRCLENRKQSITLAALRDALLPKLLSGEIRVRQAENLVAEAV